MAETLGKPVFSPGWGARLVAARKSIKKTQSDVGSALGVRNTAVSKWEGELTDTIDARSLTALEHLLGIRKAWIVSAEEPMVSSAWDRRVVSELLDDLAGAHVDGIWRVSQGSGMAPLLHPGELAFWTAADTPVPGGTYLAANKGDKPSEPGLAPASTICGQAHKVQATGEWLLYRSEDRENPGAFPPIPLKGLALLGRVVARAQGIRAPTAGL